MVNPLWINPIFLYSIASKFECQQTLMESIRRLESPTIVHVCRPVAVHGTQEDTISILGPCGLSWTRGPHGVSFLLLQDFSQLSSRLHPCPSLPFLSRHWPLV